MELTQERVRELFDYRDDGFLICRTRQSIRTKIGSIAGCLHKPSGYFVCRVDHNLYKVHRLVFLWHHGWLPEFIDHIDTDKQNNRIGNLRPASKSENMKNRGKQKNNWSGFKGVYFHKATGKWSSEISSERVKKFLGLYKTPEEAHLAYAKASSDFHMEFANAG